MLATFEEFERDPKKVWEFYQHRREKIRSASPNEAHQAVVELAAKSTDFLLVTQNVDDLHDRAEYEGQWLAEKEIVHIHGQIFVSRCTNPKCNFQRWDRDSTDPIPPLPTCPSCRCVLRPGVVWFDEENDPAEERRVDAFLSRGPCDVVVVIGTSATFDYIRDWVLKATVKGAWLIEINPTETPISRFAHHIVRGNAARTLPNLVREAAEKGPLSVG
jgi:NAD-dependent deacetylase